MRVLAIDTALTACAAAILDTAQGGISASESIDMPRGHAEALMPLLARVVDRSGLEFRDLDRVAVTVGPGSFTGLRVGISAARGIGLAAGRPVVGISTLAAFAAPHVASGLAPMIVAVVDARHDNVYMQVFEKDGRTTVSARVAPVSEAVGAALGGALITGSAAELLVKKWPAGEPAPRSIEQRAAPDIGWIARLGAVAEERSAPSRPLYLRRADARPQEALGLPRQ